MIDLCVDLWRVYFVEKNIFLWALTVSSDSSCTGELPRCLSAHLHCGWVEPAISGGKTYYCGVFLSKLSGPYLE